MRYVSIDLSSDNYLQQPQIFGGYAGEHNETVLQVKLPDRMIGIECSGYRFDFQTSEDNEILSPLIPVSELKDNILSFKLTEQLTVGGKLLFNVVAQLLNGETIDLISKTNMVVLYIADSPEGKSTIADPDGYKDEYIKMINELTGDLVGQKTTEGGEIFNDYENNQSISEFSSARGTHTFVGTKFFYIIDKNEINKTYTLKDYYLDISSSGELAVNDLFSITTGGNREDCGTIESITQEEGTNNAIVTVSNWYWDNSTGLTEPTYDNPSTSFIFRVIDKPLCGTDIMGIGASSEGYSTKALMIGCHSEGYFTIAGGKYSHAEGRNTRSGYAAHAEGWGTKAMGQEAHSEGYFTDAQGWYSHSEGNNTKSIGQSSHAEGANSVASGQFSHAEGNNNIASGQGAHAEGLNTQATEEATHSEGNTTKATGINAHAEGNQTEASGDTSHSEGYNTKATGGMSHSEGYSTTASNSYAHAEGRDTTASGNASHAEGANTKASGSQAHAEGSNTLASNFNTHAEGNNTQATKNEAHAEGCNTTASGGASHAEGEDTTASGYSSHAEGGNTVAGGYSSHAEGRNTVAGGEYSHAGGLGTIASGSSQTSIGKYNREDVNALLIIGNGTGPSATERSNAFTVNRNGTATVQTNPIEDMDVANKGYVDNLVGGVETALDSIIAMQEELIGGDA